MYSWGKEPLTDEDRSERNLANGPDDVDQKTFRSFRNRENDWLIDRDMQRKENFSGIVGVNTQDRAVRSCRGGSQIGPKNTWARRIRRSSSPARCSCER